MQNLIGAMNAFQVISHSALISIDLPLNALTLFIAIIQISSFNIIPTDKILKSILSF